MFILEMHPCLYEKAVTKPLIKTLNSVPISRSLATQPRQGHDSHQEPPRHQAVHTRQAGQMGHQELPAVRGQDGLHS